MIELERSLKYYCSTIVFFFLSILNMFMVHDLNVFQIVFNHKQGQRKAWRIPSARN
jgi:hypothetical protein